MVVFLPEGPAGIRGVKQTMSGEDGGRWAEAVPVVHGGRPPAGHPSFLFAEARLLNGKMQRA